MPKKMFYCCMLLYELYSLFFSFFAKQECSTVSVQNEAYIYIYLIYIVQGGLLETSLHFLV